MDGLWFGITREPVPRKPDETRPTLVVMLDGVKMCTVADFRDEDAQLLGQKVLNIINDAVTHASRLPAGERAGLGDLIQSEGVG